MRRWINKLLVAGLVFLSSLAYAETGLLFNIVESGAAASADVILCLNGKGPLSCQNYHVSSQDLLIRTTINHYYPAVGIKVLTSGYSVTGCTPYSNRYCLFMANGKTGSRIIINEVIASSYTVGGQVQGLLGTLVLENNNGDSVIMNADGGFTFPAALPAGSIYSVAIQSQPATQTCTVNNGTGTITNANVTNVMVNCSTNTRTIGGSISGLGVSESVVLQNNGGDNLSLDANGLFTFSEPIAQGATYNVTVLTQPATQTCTVTQGSGTVGASNITNVQVTCAINSYTVGGTVSGLVGTMVLQNNGGDDLSVSTSPFIFSIPIPQGAQYDVTVLSSPAGAVCSVLANGSGTINGANITNVEVGCVNATTLTSSVSSLALSVTGRTEYGITPTTSGISRIITINNSGSDDAIGFQVNYSGLPPGTTHTGTCDALTTLAHGTSCTIQINPGNTATSNNSGLVCVNGTAPVPGTVNVSATNASVVSTSVVVLDYGCIYQGGYVFAFNDTTSNSGSVGGKVMTTSDQAPASPNGIVWSSNGNPSIGSGGFNMNGVSQDSIPGISATSTTSVPNPSYATFTTIFSATYTNPNPFTAASFNSCKGNFDGSCNTANMLVFYNRFITNFVSGGPFPYTATAGPTPLTYYAAGLCKLTISNYSDWYLPAICEMGFGSTYGCGSLATPSLQNIQSSLRGIAAFTVPNGAYWSSTFGSPIVAVNQSFNSGTQANSNKGAMLGVRCVRSITN